MYAESMGDGRRFCPHALTMKIMKGTGQAYCAVACEQVDGSVVRGEAVRASQNDLRPLSAQLLLIQESERQRIATDLHDGLGQSLTLIKLALENVVGLLAANSLSEAEESLQQVKLKVQDAFVELRRVAMDLRPSTLDDLGILATLSWFFREFESACHGITIEKHVLIQESNIPGPLKITIFRILQEAVCNIVKHAKADLIRVSLMQTGEVLHLSIEDNGQGFDPAGRDNYCPLDKGLGLVSMKERAKFSGGTYQIESAIGQGTRISVSWSCG